MANVRGTCRCGGVKFEIIGPLMRVLNCHCSKCRKQHGAPFAAAPASVFEVTQPRVTCYRVGIRVNKPQMAALLVSHGRPGFYFRVLEEGEVGAGDEIVKVEAGPERVTVAEINALLYLPGHPASGLERAVRIPALSAPWRTSLEARCSSLWIACRLVSSK